ncbi:mavicyanin-like [Aristolochia californica]|uniref:mavicyanin-like n=1 Tax=Aristolochia californica TaxID=171875 RepID=UPI0035E39AFC
MASRTSLIGAALFLAALFHFSAAATTHVVGDGTGWTIPNGGAQFYSNWASSQTFRVGDTLVFNFVTGAHDVAQVSKEEFDSCTASNPIGPIIINGPANVPLNATGNHNFICAVGGHCNAGQRLSIVVVSADTTPPTSPNSPVPDARAPTGSTAPPRSAGNTPSSASPLAVGFGVTAFLSAISFFF